jgi:hypothetical protein
MCVLTFHHLHSKVENVKIFTYLENNAFKTHLKVLVRLITAYLWFLLIR